jgi:hypothetical protein
MGSYYSILKFVNNSLSGENISIGLIFVSGDNVFFKISKNKIALTSKLNAASKKLVDFSISRIQDFVSKDIEDQSHKLISFKKKIDVEYLNRLSSYNNGLIQFSKPSYIESDINLERFEKFYKDYIDNSNIVIEKSKNISILKQNIIEQLYNPLKSKIDIDFTLKKEQLPSLYFDFHFDSIGYNGCIHASKAIDFNNKQVSQIRAEISEYESIIGRINKFALDKSISGEPFYYIISDEYNGKSISYLDLYSMLKDDKIPLLKLISSSEINKSIVKRVIDSKAHKFSSLLAS